MMPRLAVMLLSSVLAVAAASISPACRAVGNGETAAPITAHSGDSWIVNFKDADIQTVINQIAEITGSSYVLSPTVSGKITVISQTPLKRKEVEELLLSILDINGFTVTRSGRALVIQPSADARKNKSLIDISGKTGGEAFVVRVLPVKYANVNDILQAMQPLVSDFAVLKILPDANAVLVADRAANVQKIADIIGKFDAPESDKVDTIRLSNAWVGTVMPMLEKLAPRELGASGKASFSPIRIVGNERSNSIMLRGDASAREALRALIGELDETSEDADTVQVIALHNADATKTAEMLKDMFTPAASGAAAAPGTPPPFPVSIKASAASNSLVVHAPPNVVNQIHRVLSQLDTQRSQVLIEAAIVEINDEYLDQLGVQFGVGDAAFKSGFASSSLTAGGSVGLGAPATGLAAFLSQINAPNSGLIGGGLTAAIGSNRFTALIQALAANSRANLLSTPSIMTVNNEEAKILVGQNVPFLTGSFAQATSTSGTVNPFNTIQRQDIGITLKVTPQISEDNHVLLKVEQEVSSLAPTTVAGAADIITNKRSINTVILAQNGQTVALGGLISDNKNSAKTKVPLLGDIPVIGFLFRSTQDSNSKSDLIVFLRPTILAGNSDIESVNLRKYNGLWELTLGERAKEVSPPTLQSMPQAINTLYDPNLATAHRFTPLPWLSDQQSKSQEMNKRQEINKPQASPPAATRRLTPLPWLSGKP